MSQTEFDELIQEIEDMLLNKDIDISNSPELKKSLENIISEYVEQTVNQVQRNNYDYYAKRSNQAINEVKKQAKYDVISQFKSINKEIDSLNHRVNEHSKLANKIDKNDNSLKYISEQLNKARSTNRKSKLLLKVSKSRFLMTIFASFIIGITLTIFLFILIKLF